MSWGGGFLQRWGQANMAVQTSPGYSYSRSSSGSHWYNGGGRAWNHDRSHDYSRGVRRKNGYGGGIGDYHPHGGPILKGTGASFNYNAPPKPPGNQNPGPLPPGKGSPVPGQGNPFQAGYYSNLENNLPLPQGWQRPYAMPTSVSSLITQLLYQSRQDPLDVWGSVFGRGSRSTNQGYQGGSGYGSGGSYNGGYNNRYPSHGGGGSQGGGGGGGGSPLSQSSMDALQLADAYFSPKRLELAYQLGDMETDMRRLAVNLGRQIDDPVLQAKLYKEAMKQVRTLDADQNSFALQMLEMRRKEEIQNRQFYDQLALEQDKMQQQDDQFYASLSLQRQQVNLQAKQVNAQLAQQGY